MNLKEFVNVQNMTFKSSESCFFFLGMTDVRIKEKKEWKVRINTFFMTGVGNHVVFYNYIYIYILTQHCKKNMIMKIAMKEHSDYEDSTVTLTNTEIEYI